jgi:osmotically-inducible protein OsmY
VSDTSLQRAVMTALADNPHVQTDEISAQVVDGDVVLHGTVCSILQRDEARITTVAVAGVGRVDNELRVHFLDSVGRADAATGAAVMDALIADAELHAAPLDVRSSEGTVTLCGVVAQAEQRYRAERIALGVPGVRRVRNRLEFAS